MKVRGLVSAAFLLSGLAIAPALAVTSQPANSEGNLSDRPLDFEKFSPLNRIILTQDISQPQKTEIELLVKAGIESRKAGNYQQSIETLQKALQLAQNYKYLYGEWQARSFLALTYKAMGNPQKSLELDEENLAFTRKNPALENEYFPHYLEVTSLESISNDYALVKNYQKAIDFLKQGLNIIEQTPNTKWGLLKPKLIKKLGITLFVSGNLAESEKTLLVAFEAYEKEVKSRIEAGLPAITEYESEVEVIRWIQQVLVAQNRTNEALEWAEKGRSRSFSGLLKNRLANGVQFQQFNAESPSIDKIKQIAKAQNSTLIQYTVIYNYDPELLLEFSNYEDIPAAGLLIWAIKPTGEIAFRQTKFEKDTTIVKVVKTARNGIFDKRFRGDAKAKENLKVLYNLLIEPIADLLPKNEGDRVTFIPQDSLFLVPFATIPDRDGKYLIEKHTILTAPSIQVLDLTYQQQKNIQDSAKGVLVVGNPKMPSLSSEDGSPPQQLSSLPGSEKEAQAIAQLFNTQALIGDRATKAAAEQRMYNARIIHLATHGLLDAEGGVLSSLAFAPTNSDNGFLTAREIISLKLNAELVVLSACNTGRGKITGDGVVGLSRSFIAAGVPSAIVSLWSVPDAPTSILMTTFYQSLKTGADKAQALRNAMLATMKQYPNPVDWGAFILIGEADVSATLKDTTGDSPVSGGGTENSTQTNTSRYTVFPIPDNIKNYQEFPSNVQGEVNAVFQTSLSFSEIAQFYRQAFAQKGLTEDTILTRLEDKQIAFAGSPNGKKIVIQVTDLSQQGYDLRTVSIRFEN